MLEYSKIILKKVSFDPQLFQKELQKSIHWIKKNDRKILLNWCLVEFGNRYSQTIINCFAGYYA
ncbi:MAG: hypothetical protein ACKVOU_12295 [Cytophagales bacterium]